MSSDVMRISNALIGSGGNDVIHGWTTSCNSVLLATFTRAVLHFHSIGQALAFLASE